MRGRDQPRRSATDRRLAHHSKDARSIIDVRRLCKLLHTDTRVAERADLVVANVEASQLRKRGCERERAAFTEAAALELQVLEGRQVHRATRDEPGALVAEPVARERELRELWERRGEQFVEARRADFAIG